jgi:hypothetical protein
MGLAILVALSLPNSGMGQLQNPSSRQIKLDRFNKARLPDSSPAASGESPAGTHTSSDRRKNSTTSPAVKGPVYRMAKSVAGIVPIKPVDKAELAEIGITIWRLRPMRRTDKGARTLVQDGLKQAEWVAERIEADTPLNIGDHVRLSIESPTRGYLYIVDREQYRDGSFGDAMLIFPTLRSRGGDNRVEPGRLIDIPAQEDQYSYFTAELTGDRRDQIAEVLTIIVTSEPLDFTLTERPIRIRSSDVVRWERLWSGETEHLELVGGSGQTWTSEEKEAGSAKGRQLTQSGPPPQTVFRVSSTNKTAVLVTVPLRYGK